MEVDLGGVVFIYHVGDDDSRRRGAAGIEDERGMLDACRMVELSGVMVERAFPSQSILMLNDNTKD